MPILSMTMRHGLVDQAAKFKKRVASEDTSAYKAVRRNQLVVGFPIDEGVLSFQRLYDEAIVSPAYDVWDIRPGFRLCLSYMERYLKSPAALSFFAAKLRSTTARRRTLPDDLFLSLPVPLPPLPEQRRIAAILDQADALRAKRRAALAQLDEMAQAIFVEMFGDPQENPKNWATVPCADLCNRINVGVVVKPASYYCESGVPAVRGTNIKPYGIDLSDIVYFSAKDSNGPLAKSRLWAGDVVIVRTGQPGLAAVVPAALDGANAIDIIIVTPNTKLISPVFLRELLNSKGGRQMILAQSRGQIQQHFNIGSLATAELIAPPIKLQLKFAERLEAVSDLRTAAMGSRSEFDALFASLQHRAFNGEL